MEVAHVLGNDIAFESAVSNLFNSPPPGYPPDFHVGFVEVRAPKDSQGRNLVGQNDVKRATFT